MLLFARERLSVRKSGSSPARQTARPRLEPEQELCRSRSRSGRNSALRAPSCAEPGSSFCWGPALQGSTSSSSSRSSTLGQADRARCEVRQPPTPPPPCARTSHPTCPTHGSRTFRPPCILPTRRLHPRIQPTPSAALVRRSSSLPVDPRCRLAPDAADAPSPRCRPRCRLAPDAASPPMRP